MKGSDKKSHQVGRAVLDTGAVTMAYRAVVELACARCGRAIMPGDLFSRRTQRSPQRAFATMTMEPMCMACRPLRLDDAGDADGQPR